MKTPIYLEGPGLEELLNVALGIAPPQPKKTSGAEVLAFRRPASKARTETPKPSKVPQSKAKH